MSSLNGDSNEIVHRKSRDSVDSNTLGNSRGDGKGSHNGDTYGLDGKKRTVIV